MALRHVDFSNRNLHSVVDVGVFVGRHGNLHLTVKGAMIAICNVRFNFNAIYLLCCKHVLVQHSQILNTAHEVYLQVLYGSQNKFQCSTN